VRLMFQPSEEQATAPGAKALIAEGMLDGVDAVIGYHVRAGAPEGEIQFTPGAATTSGDIWELDVVGKGGHGSRPQDAVDPTVAAAQIICALQTVVSREIPPGERVVISIGTLKSGSTVNVIPEKCEITGNIRTTNPDIRATLPERIERIAQGVGLAMRCRTDFRFIPVYPSVVNDEAMGLLLEEAAGELFGAEKVKRVPISSGSDDFNFYSAERPSIYFNVGMGGLGTPYAAAHHSPQFRTNDAILKTCAAAVVATACKFLEAKTK
ncbi:MAG: amidohydrolase, partial [Pyramidobacter sp.]|nr:amidohydrolase [Pyramidobacter sp.]